MTTPLADHLSPASQESQHSESDTTAHRVAHLSTATWLALTLHAPRPQHDTMLIEHLPRLLETLPTGTDRWFFERCTDAVRLRLRGTPRTLRPHLLDWGCGILRAGAVSHLTMCRYQPDVDRYGGASTAGAAIEFLHADSNAALTQLRFAHAGALTVAPSTLARLSRSDLTSAWYDRPLEPRPEGVRGQLALLAPWWQRRTKILRCYGHLVRVLDPPLIPTILHTILDRHRD